MRGEKDEGSAESAEDDTDYDLMLLDWHMPEQDGLAMLRQAYATPGIGLPLVVLMAPTFELEAAVAASDDVYLERGRYSRNCKRRCGG